MSLSKVHRLGDQVDFKRVRFLEFDELGELPDPGWDFVGTPPAGGAAPGAAAHTETFDHPGHAQGHGADREESYAEGRRAGLQEAEERFESVSSALGTALEEISRLRESLLKNSSQDMLRLVMGIARQVIHTEVTVQREIVLSTIDRALRAAVRSDSYHVRVHPDDLALVTDKKPLFLASISGLSNVTFEGDAAVARGGARLESELGEVDATIDGQLMEFRKALAGSVEKG